MRTYFILGLLLYGSAMTAAFADSTLIDRYTWHNRLLLIFTPGQDHPEYIAQNRGLAGVEADLIDRDLVVLRMMPGEAITIDNNLSNASNSAAVYRDFAVETGLFRVLLIGKDGTLKLSRSTAVSANDLFVLIDSMPMRQMEMQSQDSSIDRD